MGWRTTRLRQPAKLSVDSSPQGDSTQASSTRSRSKTRPPVKEQGALNIAKIGSPTVTTAVFQAAQLSSADIQQDTVCPKTQQNIVVVSMPSPQNADRYICIKSIQVNGVTHDVNAYETAAEDTTKGVIRGIPLSDTSQQINANIVNTRNLLALAAKRIGTTTTVVIAFSSPDVPYLILVSITLEATLFPDPFTFESTSMPPAKPPTNKVSFAEALTGASREGHNTASPPPTKTNYNTEIANLKKENAIVCDRIHKPSQEFRDLEQPKTPAPTPPAEASASSSHDAPLTPAPKKRALQEGGTGQAYLASGTNLRRYVVNGVGHDEEPEKLLQELSCPTHRFVAARYLGSGRTCLIRLQGLNSPPERILYYGCVLRPRPFKPSVVYCYSCFKQGHMKPSCPFPPKDDKMEPDPSASFQCGLCQTNILTSLHRHALRS
ncbi:hypothetical protein HPB49_010158 [Dermacentor silvarum]|uniref:Uncharacterized protein n=1 Tax=Dermacentor silvarum TaxID=543639 RepID=A0ACB8CWD4_DERSI|nr:hypothetical protein HPB49_010158 [Dermacentor silvarum]